MILGQSPIEKNFYKASIMGSATAAIMDMTTTGYCLGAGTCEEKNPILAPFSQNPLAMGFVKGAISSSIILAIHEILYKKGHHRLAIIANFINTGIIIAIAIRNSRIK